MYTCLSGELMFISCREQTWGRGDQTVGYGAERGSVCCKQQQIKKKQPSAQRFALARGISPLTNRTSDVHFSMTSARPSLLSSPLLSSPLLSNPSSRRNAKKAKKTLPLCSPSKRRGRCPYTRSLCRSVSSQGLGASSRSPVIEAASERGGRGKRKGSFYLPLLSDMALVRVEGLVCEAPPQPLPWLVSRYYL